MLHEAGHPAPWSIALFEVPTIYQASAYELRWGIDPMVTSNFKTRGFGIEWTARSNAPIARNA